MNLVICASLNLLPSFSPFMTVSVNYKIKKYLVFVVCCGAVSPSLFNMLLKCHERCEPFLVISLYFTVSHCNGEQLFIELHFCGSAEKKTHFLVLSATEKFTLADFHQDSLVWIFNIFLVTTDVVVVCLIGMPDVFYLWLAYIRLIWQSKVSKRLLDVPVGQCLHQHRRHKFFLRR